MILKLSLPPERFWDVDPHVTKEISLWFNDIQGMPTQSVDSKASGFFLGSKCMELTMNSPHFWMTKTVLNFLKPSKVNHIRGREKIEQDESALC
jgi:hypothetical protein